MSNADTKKNKTMASFQKKKALMQQQLKRAEEKLNQLENKRAAELGKLAMACGLAEKNNEFLEQAFFRIAKENSHA
jgi:hypothetical protein